MRLSSIRRKAIEGLKASDPFSVSRTFSEQDVIRFFGLGPDISFIDPGADAPELINGIKSPG